MTLVTWLVWHNILHCNWFSIKMTCKLYVTHTFNVTQYTQTYVYMYSRIRKSSNFIELIFWKDHLSTFRASLKKTLRVKTSDSKKKQENCIFRRSKVEKWSFQKIRSRLLHWISQSLPKSSWEQQWALSEGLWKFTCYCNIIHNSKICKPLVLFKEVLPLSISHWYGYILNVSLDVSFRVLLILLNQLIKSPTYI